MALRTGSPPVKECGLGVGSSKCTHDFSSPPLSGIFDMLYPSQAHKLEEENSIHTEII